MDWRIKIILLLAIKASCGENNTMTEDYSFRTVSKKSSETKQAVYQPLVFYNDTLSEAKKNLSEDFKNDDYLNDTELCDDETDFCNMTKEEYMEMLYEYIFPQPYEWVLITTHGIVFLVGFIGNVLVCIAVIGNSAMRTVTNYFIVNLAVADLMVLLICLPPTVLWDVTKTWFLGTAMCRIVLYFQSVSVTVSVLTLTFISLDRWYAICFPLQFNSTTGRAKTAILIIWFISLCFNLPEFLVLQVQNKVKLRFNVQYFMQCTPTWSVESDLKWHIVKALFLYTLPLILMMIAYWQIVRVLWSSENIPGHVESHRLCTAVAAASQARSSNRRYPPIHTNLSTEAQLKSRRKAAKMLVAVVVMFAVCYFPVHLMSVMRIAYDVQQTNMMTCLALISHVMCYANSAVNPLIYNFMSGKFRREFHRTYFRCFCCCCDPPTEPPVASFAPIGSSRSGTARTVVRRADSCASYRLTHISPSNQNSINRDYVRNTNTSFIEQMNGNRHEVVEKYIARSTNSLDCKPHYDCFKLNGKKDIPEETSEEKEKEEAEAAEVKNGVNGINSEKKSG